MDLVYKNEKALFVIAAIISAIFWLVLLAVTFGGLLIYLLFGYLFFLFAHSAFISHLQGGGVRISQEQYPDLYHRLVQACGKLGVKDIPEAYLLRTDSFNALATRFLSRDFVVIFTDVIDALEDHPDAIDFYLGHELGHIHRKHIRTGVFLMPASILPLLGAAYRRAQEYTCDRYGAAACNSDESIKFALAAIAAGNSRYKSINLDAYLTQIKFTSGFWMSFNELTGDYPWLTKRMAAALAFRRGEDATHPERHGFAWFLAMFCPRFGMGGGIFSVLIVVAIIGILAAVALPAYKEFAARAQVAATYSAALQVEEKVKAYVEENQELPDSLGALGYDVEVINDIKGQYEITLDEASVINAQVLLKKTEDDGYIFLTPTLDDEGLTWSCEGSDIAEKYLPAECR